MKLCYAVALALASSSCTPGKERVWLRVELPSELAGSEKQLQVLPKIAEASRQLGRGIVALELKRDAGRTRLQLPGACPLVVDARTLSGAAPELVSLRPLFDAGPRERVVGVGQPFELQARPNCPEAERAEARLSFAGGAALDALTIQDRGRSLRARTRSTLPAQAELDGIVPVSAREHARLRSEITLRIQPETGPALQRTLGIAAVARASGLPNVGLEHPVLLSESGWQLLQKPLGSQAALRATGGLTELTPDVFGVYRLQARDGRPLSIQSGRYDQTPLDCGRSDCHAEIAKSAQSSPMTQVLASDLGGCHSLTEPECATACHATGEPGTPDGGFAHVAQELALPALPLEHDDLPRALRKLGGVGCLACHGPGAIPEPSGRWAILRSDVCAVCHDAPPRYGHVAALEASRMGHADHSEKSRQSPECARCHTTWGALGRPAPGPEVKSFGLGCVTCHDVHPHGPGHVADEPGAATHAGLLRNYALPATLPSPPPAFLGVSRVCISCHAPSSNTLRPEASAAAIVAGQGGLDPATGAALALEAPHVGGGKGCLACHDSGPEGLLLGKSHGFRATAASCSACHAGKERDPRLAARAQLLLARLDPGSATASAEQPWHARDELVLPTPAQTRALRNVLLVLEDPAADIHHPAYARALLDAAERFAPGAPP